LLTPFFFANYDYTSLGQSMKHSVIIPAKYNAQWIGQAIESVLDQTLDIDQLIIISDDDQESTDVAKGYLPDPRVNIFQTENHVGSYQCQNVALKYFTGDILSFIGSDDLWHRERSAEIVAHMNSWNSMVNTFHVKIDERGRELKKDCETLGGVFSYHKEMLRQLGGFKAWPCSADSDFYHRAVKAGGVRSICRRHLYQYRQHPKQLTQMESTRVGSKRRMIYQKLWGSGPLCITPDIPNHWRIR